MKALLCVSTGLAMFPVAALAQGTDTAGPMLDDIVVTAEKRSVSLQSTPLAISAVTADTIEARRITDATGLNAVAPNLSTTMGPSSRSHLIIQVRGIGESEPILTADSPVGVYVDGVIVGRSTGAIFELVDLERIEVLRGPQGTLYGRNTTGGAVNLITKKPSESFGVDMLGSYGNRGYWQGRVSVDTGDIMGSGLKAKLSYLHKEADGWVDDINSPAKLDPGAYNTDALRVAVAFERSNFRFDYAFDWADSNGVAPLNQLTVANQNVIDYFTRSPMYGGAAFIPPSAERRDTARPDRTSTWDRNISHTATAEIDVSDSTMLRLITGFRKWKNRIDNTDLDGNSGLKGLVVSPAPAGVKPVQLFGADNNRHQSQFSQEVNAIGSIGDHIDYVAGLYYFREEGEEYNPQTYTVVRSIPGVGLAGINLHSLVDYRTTSESKAVFGQGTYHFTDRLSFIGGLRYTWDDKQLYEKAPYARILSRGFSKFNYAATLNFQATPDIMTYARIASGYKAGGFNPRAVNDGYDPETLTNFELGLKSDLFDKRLRFNTTVFYMRLNDKQVNQFVAGSGGAASQTLNAGKADFKGVEAEIEAVPFEGLRLNGAVGYVHRKFKELLALDPADNQIKNYASVGRFSYSPSTTANAGAQYSIEDVAGGTLSFRVDFTYKGTVHYNVLPIQPFSYFDEQIKAPAYGLLDARVMLADVPVGFGRLSITGWGRNVTNKVYRISGIDFGALGFGINAYGEPRAYGLDVRFRF